MPRKGMRSVIFKSSASNSPARTTPPSSPMRQTFSETLIQDNIDAAQSLISKWEDSDSGVSYTKIASLFRDHGSAEAKQYLNSVKHLQSAMQYYISENTGSENLIRAQRLMQLAVKRLEKEFYIILSASRDVLDPETVSSRASTRSSVSDFEDESEDESIVAGESVSEVERVSMEAMADLKAIADCMISAGYGKECVKIYKIIRKSIVDESLYHLGVEKMSFSQLQKLNWEVMEIKIKSWLRAMKTAVKTLFYGERILCDHVFSAWLSIRESCFNEITRDGAMMLFGFSEMVAKCKKTPEKMFRILDLYESISGLWPEIEDIFSFESTATIRTQAVTSLIKLAEGVRSMLADFETAIQKDLSKSPVPGGGVHPLTRYVMNYITFLADYSGSLTDILADYPLTVQSPLPESHFDSSESPISVRIAWIILVLLCKLDGKAELQKDVALSYLFLANNLQYVVVKIRSSNLMLLLGEDWITKHEEKIEQYASNYEKMGWSKVFGSLPENPTAEISLNEAKECFKRFNKAFEEAYRKQSSWVVPEAKLRDEIKISVAKKLVPIYRVFYEKYRNAFKREMGVEVLVRFAPDDLGNYLSDLYYGNGGPGSVSSFPSSSSSPSPSSSARGRGGR